MTYSPLDELVKMTFATNYYGTVELTKKMTPLINKRGKIIIVGSMDGKTSQLSSKTL